MCGADARKCASQTLLTCVEAGRRSYIPPTLNKGGGVGGVGVGVGGGVIPLTIHLSHTAFMKQSGIIF